MEKSFLAFVILCFCSILVDSQGNERVPNRPTSSTPPPPPSPPPPYSQPPPPTLVSPPPQTPTRPPPRTLTPPRRSQTPSPPFHHPSPPPQPKKNETMTSKTNHNGHKKPKREHATLGKRIGLLFVVIAGVLQICAVAFLVLKRHQLFKIKDRYETCS